MCKVSQIGWVSPHLVHAVRLPKISTHCAWKALAEYISFNTEERVVDRLASPDILYVGRSWQMSPFSYNFSLSLPHLLLFISIAGSRQSVNCEDTLYRCCRSLCYSTWVFKAYRPIMCSKPTAEIMKILSICSKPRLRCLYFRLHCCYPRISRVMCQEARRLYRQE